MGFLLLFFLEKRSKEVILFGNHQNKPRVPYALKKSDPSFDASANPSLVDQQGSIHVVTPEESEPEIPVAEDDQTKVDLPEVGQDVEVVTSKDLTQTETNMDSAKDLEVNSENTDDLKTSDVTVEQAINNADSPETGAGEAEVGTNADSGSKEDTSAEDHDDSAGGDVTAVLATPYKDELEDFYEYLLSYGKLQKWFD